MTRRKWTSADQEEWLKARIARFSDAQVNKTTTKEFFPEILKEWREAWPCPGPTPVEIAQAGSVEKAIQKRRSQEITVCQLTRCLVIIDGTNLVHSVLRLGSTIIHGEQRPEMEYVGF